MTDQLLKDAFLEQIEEIDYPCVMAKSALLSGNIHTIIAEAFCPAPFHAREVLADIYAAIDVIEDKPGYHSIAVLFRQPAMMSEAEYDEVFWPYLQSLHMLDSAQYGWNENVSSDPSSKNFSFSLKGEAFYVIGMHNKSSRKARVTSMPAIIFNPHRQFDALREKGKYTKIRDTIRERDAAYAGSPNPMLQDFGEASEVFQYTGTKLDKENWTCPFKPQTQA